MYLIIGIFITTFCRGRLTPNSDEVDRRLANLRKSLSAIFGRVYSSKPRKDNSINK